MSDARLAAARAVLASRGLGDVAVSVGGFKRDILAVAAPLGLHERLRQAAGELKATGFAFVALDLSDRVTGQGER
ncbi:MAG: hypothetical protein ACRELD_06165 [Longimicrobiales bacterium]